MKKLVNLKGVKTLNKNEQKAIQGGYLSKSDCLSHCPSFAKCVFTTEGFIGDGGGEWICIEFDIRDL
jgi:hypothetical protein